MRGGEGGMMVLGELRVLFWEVLWMIELFKDG